MLNAHGVFNPNFPTAETVQGPSTGEWIHRLWPRFPGSTTPHDTFDVHPHPILTGTF